MYKTIFFCLILICGKSFAQEVDTIHVFQSDTATFDQNMDWIQRPCQKPHFHVSYSLKTPVENAYYFIYNEQGQLVQEGKYSSDVEINGIHYSGFLNTKYYYYKKNGKLVAINYQKDGRNEKTEVFKRGKIKRTQIYS